MRYLAILAALCAPGLLTPAAEAGPVEDAVACLALPDGPERLACFNTTVPRLQGMGAAPAAAASPPPAPSQRLGAEQLPVERRAGDGPAEVTATVTSVSVGGDGRPRFALDNGQVWAQREPTAVPVQAGGRVTIRPGLLGSYTLVPDGRNATIKVRRVK